MSKTIVYLIRHSKQLRNENYGNVKESDQTKNEKIILSVEGEEKAKALSQREELKNIDIIYSSNYVRAISTAKYIADKNNLIINIESNLGGRKLGNLEKLKELGKDKKYTFTEEQLLDENLKNIDGESRIEVNKRMTDTLNKILKENEGKNIVIVSHAAAIKFLLMNWCTINEDIKLTYNQSIIEVNSPCLIKLEFEKLNLKDLSLIV